MPNPLERSTRHSKEWTDGLTDESDSGSNLDYLGSDRKVDYTEEVIPAQTKIRFADLDSLPDIKGKYNGRVASKNPYDFDIITDEIGVENDNDRDVLLLLSHFFF